MFLLLPFLKIGTTDATLQSSGTSPVLHEVSKMEASGRERTPANSLSTLGCNPSGPGAFVMSSALRSPSTSRGDLPHPALGRTQRPNRHLVVGSGSGHRSARESLCLARLAPCLRRVLAKDPDSSVPLQPFSCGPFTRERGSLLGVVQKRAQGFRVRAKGGKSQPTCRFLFCALQVLQYQAGYIACAAIAVVYFVAVPLAGLSICCCRRRRRCGGRLKAYRRSLLCRCHVLMACLFLTTLVILGGAIFAFAANQKVKEAVEPGTRDALNTLQALRHHLSGVRRGVQQTVQQFAVPKEQVLSDLNNVGRSIGTIIHFVLKGSVYSALAALKGRVQDLQDTKHHLQTIGRTVQTLMQRQAELEAALRARKPSITALLGDPRCTYCASAASRAQGLEPEANFRKVSSSRTWVLKLRPVGRIQPTMPIWNRRARTHAHAHRHPPRLAHGEAAVCSLRESDLQASEPLPCAPASHVWPPPPPLAAPPPRALRAPPFRHRHLQLAPGGKA
ncbi:Prominin-2 [Varanus komodoensis]|nr:Prominin-2 [Varanus komodoensis]